MSERKITAKDVVALLAAKHAEDVFVPECKNGPSQASSHIRLDGWAMKRSWSNPLVVGYEVKVSRADFLNDTKWPGYLPLCNCLYFVAPRGLIQPAELGDSVGLMEVAGTGRTLVTKKKAPYREVEIPDSLFRYILMCRANIGAERDGSNRVEYWREWLAQKKESRTIGYMVRHAIREHVDRVNRENESLRKKHEEYDDVRRFAQELGFSEPDKNWISRHTVKDKLERLQRIVPPWFCRELTRLADSAKSIAEELKGLGQ